MLFDQRPIKLSHRVRYDDATNPPKAGGGLAMGEIATLTGKQAKKILEIFEDTPVEQV